MIIKRTILKLLPLIIFYVHGSDKFPLQSFESRNGRQISCDKVTETLSEAFKSNRDMSEYSIEVLLSDFTSTSEGNCLIRNLMEKNENLIFQGISRHRFVLSSISSFNIVLEDFTLSVSSLIL